MHLLFICSLTVPLRLDGTLNVVHPHGFTQIRCHTRDPSSTDFLSAGSSCAWRDHTGRTCRVEPRRESGGQGSCPSGYEDSSRSKHKHNYNRKSCGVPVAINNAYHTSSSATMLEEIVTYECQSGHSLESHLMGTRASRQRVVLRQVDPWQYFAPGSSSPTTCKKVTCGIPLSLSIASVRR